MEEEDDDNIHNADQLNHMGLINHLVIEDQEMDELDENLVENDYDDEDDDGLIERAPRRAAGPQNDIISLAN